jgi:hypothetical protein
MKAIKFEKIMDGVERRAIPRAKVNGWKHTDANGIHFYRRGDIGYMWDEHEQTLERFNYSRCVYECLKHNDFHKFMHILPFIAGPATIAKIKTIVVDIITAEVEKSRAAKVIASIEVKCDHVVVYFSHGATLGESIEVQKRILAAGLSIPAQMGNAAIYVALPEEVIR